MDRIDIEPQDAWTVLLCDNTKWPTPIKDWMKRKGRCAEVYCEDMLIAKIESEGLSWVTNRIACTNYTHGVHSRFANMLSQKQREMIHAAAIEVPLDKCDECEDGWHIPGDEQCRKQLAMADAIGMFRGVCIGQNGTKNLNASRSNDMLGMFLSRGSKSLYNDKRPSDNKSERASFISNKE